MLVMHFLFCVQTIFEMDNPWIYTNYLTNYFRKYILNIRDSYSNSSFTILMGEAASYKYEKIEGVEVVIVTQQEMLKYGEFDQREVLCEYFRYCHEGGNVPKYINYHVSLLKNKLVKIPDFIISRDNAPYLKKIFPSACLLYTEVGFISRKPFEQTMYFDSVGMNCGSFLYKHWEEIEKTINWNEEKKVLIEELKSSIRSLLMEKNPYIELIKKKRRGFSKIYLLPLQFSGFSNIDAEINMKSQLDVVMYVLDRVPQNIGVVVTTHPDYNILNDGNMVFLKKKYSNLIFDKLFLEYNASSQYILGLVDGVINLSSTVGLQTLFWDIPCLQLGKYFAHYIARKFDENVEYDRLNSFELQNNNKVLYWLLTRYIIPPRYYKDAKWLINYLVHIKNSLQEGDIANIYKEIDTDENLFIKMKENLDVCIPEKRKKNKSSQYYEIVAESTRRYFGNRKMTNKLKAFSENILIYGKGSLAYLLELEINSDEALKERYVGIIDYKTYKEYLYTGKELIVITPIQEYDEILQNLKKVTQSKCVSFEELFYE